MGCKVLRIGVFFDGTGNNLINDQAAQKQSNIAKLYQLYAKLTDGASGDDGCYFIGNKASECKIITTAIYIEGLGTQANTSDSFLGLAMGSDGSKRVDNAIKELKRLTKVFPDEEYKYYLDVFGFSRGAALAREFINTVQDDKLNVIFRFVGLFDTVGSFGKAGDNENYKPITEEGSETATLGYELIGIKPPADEYEPYNFNLSPLSAEKIVHLVALDEYRKNFPLTDIEGAGQTYCLIGAHSDVGGGYLPNEVESLFEFKEDSASKTHTQLETPENDVEIGEKWILDPLNMRSVPNYPNYLESKRMYKYVGVRSVSNDLQQVGLMMMYNLAVKEGVPFLPFTLDLSPASVKKITQEIAYTCYNPTLQVLHRSSESIADLLGEKSTWQDELKAYCIEAIENPSFMSSYLGDVTPYFNNNANARPLRQKHHRRILAKYAHNSSCTTVANELMPPPIGFKHRRPTPFEGISNSAHYASSENGVVIPMRVRFSNEIGKAINNKKR